MDADPARVGVPTTVCAMSQQRAAHGATPAGAEKFGATPVAGVLAMVVLAVVGAGLFLLTNGRTVTATCGSDRMAPGDLCDTVRRGVVTGTQSYGEVLAQARRLNTVGTWLGVALVAVAIVFTVLVVLRWQQDRALRERLRQQHDAPVSSHSSTARPNVLLVVVGCGLLGLAAFLILQGLPTTSIGFFAGAAAAGLGGVALLAASLPANGALLQVFEGGVRAVVRNRVHEVPWRDVDHTIQPQRGSATHRILAPGMKAVDLAGVSGAEQLRQEVQRRVLEARIPPSIDAFHRGETVSFGVFTVSQHGVGTARRLVPWSELGQITLHQGQVTIHRLPRGKLPAISLAQVRNYPVFVSLVDLVRSGRVHPGMSTPS